MSGTAPNAAMGAEIEAFDDAVDCWETGQFIMGNLHDSAPEEVAECVSGLETLVDAVTLLRVSVKCPIDVQIAYVLSISVRECWTSDAARHPYRRSCPWYTQWHLLGVQDVQVHELALRVGGVW